MSPVVVDKSQVQAADIAKQKEIYLAQLKEELDNANARITELKAGGHDLSPAEQADKRDAYFTLYECLVALAQLLAPFPPFQAMFGVP